MNIKQTSESIKHPLSPETSQPTRSESPEVLSRSSFLAQRHEDKLDASSPAASSSSSVESLVSPSQPSQHAPRASHLAGSAPTAPTMPPEQASTRLTRIEMQKPERIRQMAHFLAIEHSKTDGDVPADEAKKPLFLFADARGRLSNVENSDERAQACKLDTQMLHTVLNALEENLADAPLAKVYGDFNYYPGALSLSADGEIQSDPDHRNTGWHSPFEILNRFAFTTRLDHTGLESLAETYTLSTAGRAPSASELKSYGEAKYVFDLMYYLYFIDIAFDAPTSGTEAGIKRQQALSEAENLLSRIHLDHQWLVEHGIVLPKPYPASSES